VIFVVNESASNMIVVLTYFFCNTVLFKYYCCNITYMLVGLKNQNVYRNAFAILHFDSADTILTQDIHSVCGYSIKMCSNYLVGSTHVNKGRACNGQQESIASISIAHRCEHLTSCAHACAY
jgi:hypothetical protein